ncbi:MAG: TrmH family RNA methyltransferase [Patescibacteria group bacterium]
MIVILHNIRSLHNVGSIFRTADAAGVEKIYLCGITPKPIDEFGKTRQQLAKVSLGAEKYVKWERVKNATRLIDKLKNPPTGGKYKIFAIEQSKKSIPYHKIKLKTGNEKLKIVLVTGNEIKGLPLSILKKSDKILEIPMRGAMIRQARHPRRTGRGKESLNVAVAFGIVAFHLMGVR